MPKRNLLLYIIFFSVISSFPLSAQENIKCYSCSKKIKGKYLEVNDKYFHPKHFTCSRCRKPIPAAFMEIEGKFYHPDCFAAEEGLICYVCKKPLSGRYSIDMYDNKYHSYHKDKLNECDNCSRIISENTTGGGKAYSDGRHICNICYQDAVTDNGRINSLLKKVTSRLKDLGLNINERNVSIKGVNRTELKRSAGRSYSSEMRGFCNTSRETEYSNKRVSKITTRHMIYVINGIPSLTIESVIAHELMHVWLNDNTKSGHSDELREGSCNYISYLYLKSVNSRNARQLIKMLETNEDEVYGEGFMMVRSRFENKDIKELLSYLKRSDSI